MFFCRLATINDGTPEVLERVRFMAEKYCGASEDAGATPQSIAETFHGYIADNVTDPQFWLVLDDDYPIGFMVTTLVEYNGIVGVQIAQGLLEPQYLNDRISYACMEKVEEFAKTNGFHHVTCITRRNPMVYERWIRKAGYRREYTAFLKEV